MLIHEIVLQGVPGSPGLARLTLGQGVNLVVPGRGQGLGLVRLIVHVLFDESVEPPQDLVAPGAEVARAGLTLQDRGGRIYRVLRDLKLGSVQLLAFDPAARTFQPVSSRAAEVGQYLRAQVQVPAEDLLSGLFWLRGEDAPSRQPSEPVPTEPELATGTPPGGMPAMGLAGRQMTPPGGMPAMGLAGRQMTPPGGMPAMGLAGRQMTPPGGVPAASGAHVPEYARPNPAAPSGPGPASGRSREEIQRRLEALEAQAAAVAEIDEVQFELDGVQRKIDEIDAALARVRELRARVADLDRRITAFGDLAHLPEDITERVRAYTHALDRRDRALDRIEQERDSFSEYVAVPAEPLVRSKVFLGGIAGTLAVAGLAIGLDLRILFALLPLGLGTLAYALLAHFDEREEREGVQRRLSMLDDRREKAERSFEIETSLVRRTMEQIGATSAAELLERLEQREALLQDRSRLAAELEALEGSEEARARQAEREALQAQADALEAKLAGSGGYATDPAELRREIEALRAELEAPEARPPEPTPAAAAMPFADAGGGSFAARSQVPSGPPAPVAPPNPGPRLLGLLEDVLHRPREDLMGLVAPRLAQYAAALSQGRWRGASFVGLGEVQADEATGPSIEWAALPPLDRDLLYLALRLTLAELAVRQAPVPLVFEAPHLGTAPQALVAKMLAALGRVTQVLVVSDDGAWRSIANQTVGVGG